MRERSYSAHGRGIALLLALLFCVIPLAACKRGSDLPLSPGLSLIEGAPIHDKNVALATDHFTVTPGMMAFYFYDYGGAVMSSMETQKAFDQTKSLHDQMYTDTLTWYDVIMNETLASISKMLIYCEAAHAAGVSLTEAQSAAVNEQMETLRLRAAANTLDLATYLSYLYGPLVTEQDMRRVMELEALATAHSPAVSKELEGAITTEQIKAYAQSKGLDDATPSRNITFVMIPHQSGLADSASIDEVLAALRKAPEAATLKGFEERWSVATEENLTPENIGVEAIAQWLYADGRKVAEYAALTASGVTYVVLYTGDGLTFGEVTAKMRLYEIGWNNWYNAWVERVQFGYNYDILDSYDVA